MATIAFQPAVAVGLGPDRIVMIARIGRVDRDDRQMRQVLALAQRQLRTRRAPRRSPRARNSCAQPVLVDRDQAEAARRERIAEHRIDPRRHPRPPPRDLAQHQVAGLRVLQLADRQLAPLLLLDRGQPEPLALLADHAQHQLGALLELLHRVGDHGRPRAPRSAPACGRRCPARRAARARSPAAWAAACRRASSGTAQTLPLSSTSTTRSTVTFGTPPVLWNARPGAESISPSSAMSLSRALSTILSCPTARTPARSRACPPAGPDVAMKSRICLRGRQAGGALAGHGTPMIVMPDLIRHPPSSPCRHEGRQTLAHGRGDDYFFRPPASHRA